MDCCGVRVMCAVKNGCLQSLAHLINGLPPHRQLKYTAALCHKITFDPMSCQGLSHLHPLFEQITILECLERITFEVRGQKGF